MNSYIIKSELQPKCSYRNCNKNVIKVLEPNNKESLLFKSCHYCLTFYCSKECRQLDWNLHISYENCIYGRSTNCCKKILSKTINDTYLRKKLNKFAKNSFLNTTERGLIWFDFSCYENAREFLDKTSAPLKTSNLFKYICFNHMNIDDKNNCNYKKDIINKILCNELETNEEFRYLSKYYNTDTEFIILVSIRLDSLNTNMNEAFVRKNIHKVDDSVYVLKYIKLPFGTKKYKAGEHLSNRQDLTMILTPFKSGDEQDMKRKEVEERQLFLAKIINEFEYKNINLRTDLPDIYLELCNYVDQINELKPKILFLNSKDLKKNKLDLFMCLLMPKSDPL
jgi:hypothetical protein